MKRYLYLLIIFTTLNLFSQGEANIWYFGENAGLDFNNCKPFAITDGELDTIEGCSSFSDPNGNLLFYSDGTTVWNKEHTIMPNGTNLLGNSSSSQSAMIIPKPGSNNIYYLFTVGAEVNNGDSESGFNYYTIDIELENGLGDVTAGPIDLSEGKSDDWSEKIAAVKGAESGIFWVLSYVKGQFYSYKITTEGVSTSPVKSSFFIATDKRGYLKISPDGTKVAIAHQADGALYIYDFNDTTGRLSNQLLLPLSTEGNKPYGVEFSANSEKLYIHASNDAFNPISDENLPDPEHISTLFQFDVSLNSDTSIINSRKIIHEGNLFRGSLQLGPDRKIYRSLSRSYTEGIPLLGVIENPEKDGGDCNYKHASVGLLGRLSTQGLPPFIASIFSQVQIIAEGSSGIQSKIDNGETLNLCIGDNVSIYSESLSGSTKYRWYFNGGTTPISTDPILQLDEITIGESGKYNLSVFHTDLCGNSNTLEAEFNVNILDLPIIKPNVDFKNCDEDENLDGFTDYNLEEINEIIILGDTSLSVTWYLDLNDADEKINSIDPLKFNNKTANVVYARVENSAGCHSVSTVNLQVSTTSFDNNYVGEKIYSCDDDGSNDGFYLFDLSQISNNILDQFPDPDLSVHYYKSSIEAHLEINEIPSDQLYKNETAFNQTLYVRVESTVNGDCFGIGPYVDLAVYLIPEFEVIPEAIICLNISPQTQLEIINPKGKYAYNWIGPNGFMSKEENPIVNSAGEYVVTATQLNPNGSFCTSITQTVNVIESTIATIKLQDITITDLSTNNTILIDPSNLGIGDYEFSLTSEFGPFQDSTLFEMVAAGDHILFIKDKNECGIATIKVSVIGFPNYFTPNNDGVNDTWQFIGANQNYYTSVLVKIFDRFGKIITVLDVQNNSWDGNYNGKQLPASDYWFTAEVMNKDGEIKNRKGHFSLIRRNRN